MNSFFASVEQHLDPAIRGKPVGITAMEGRVGSCVAASYEAKAFGIKTGTSVRDALRLCPQIVLLPSRHRLYVRYNLRVAAVLDRYAELERIRSVDEFQIALSGEATTLEGAAALVTTLKAAVAAEIGPSLRFSAGIGPNHLLAKIAGKLEKPNGFQWLSANNMPGRLDGLALDDLPGISRAMRDRLMRAGVASIRDLHALDPRHARAIWRSVEGERFVRALQGMAVPLLDTRRGGYGQSKILAPAFRRPTEAYLVSRWLVEKAATRLRRDRRVAARFGVQIGLYGREGWTASMSCAATQDTAVFLRLHRTLWRTAWRHLRDAQVMMVGIQLDNVTMLDRRNGDLLMPLTPGERSMGERVALAVEMINQRFGPGTVRYGLNRPHPGFFERG